MTQKNWQLSFSFELSRFFYTAKKARQKPKHLENEKSFEDEIKTIFHHF